MRIPRSWITPLAKTIAETLLKDELIVPDIAPAALTHHIEVIINDELSLEDRLNDEVHQMLGKMNTGNTDYRKLFELMKQKLIKERGIII